MFLIDMTILMCMPTKNIYVADGDLDLFDRAAELAGSMSAAVAAGLRLYVAQQQKVRERAQMHQIELEVQDGPVVVTKRFTGRQLLRYELRDGMQVTTFRAYVTARDQLAIHTRTDPDWSRFSSPKEDDPVWEDERTWGAAWWTTTQRTLRVFADVDAAASELPADIVPAIRAALAAPGVEDLDI